MSNLKDIRCTADIKSSHLHRLPVEVRDEQTLGFFLALGSAIGPATRPILIKLVSFEFADPSELVALRMALSLPFFILGAIIAWKRATSALSIPELAYIAALGIMSAYWGNLLQTAGIRELPATVAAAFVYLQPVAVLVIQSFALKALPSQREIFSAMLIVGGVIVMAGANGFPSHGFALGILLVLSSVVTSALYVVGAERIVQKSGPIRLACYSMIAGSICCVIDPIIRQTAWNIPLDIDAWLPIFLLVSISTVLPVFLLVGAIKLIGSKRTAILGMIGPLIGLGAISLFLEEKITLGAMLSVCLIMAGLVINAMKGRPGWKATNSKANRTTNRQ